MTRLRSSVPLLALLGVLGAAAWWWHGPATRFPSEKAQPSGDEMSSAADAAPTRLVVDFRDDVPASVLAGNGFEEIPVSDFSRVDRLYVIPFATSAEAAAAAEVLRRDPHVESVDHDVEAALPPDEWADEWAAAGPLPAVPECGDSPPEAADRGFPNDPCFRFQWHMTQVGLPNAWKLGQGHKVVVAVVDTGVSRVPDLAKTELVKGFNFVANTDNADDDHGHGTHVAGTIAQSTNNRLGVSGVAWGASIMPLKVLSSSGSGSMAGIAQAIRYAADHGAHVINMSLGGAFPMRTVQNAIEHARSKGVTVVAAAGNDGRGKVSYPARYPGVIAVASTQFDETTTFYSNWGPQIDIAAPGGNTRVDQNGDGKPDGVLQNTIVPGQTHKTDYLWFMGTSMASPHVAGVAALVIGAGVTKPQAVEQVLLDTARKPKRAGEAGGRLDDHYGSGIVNAEAALRKARRGKGAGELGLGAAFAALGIASLRRRGRLGAKAGAAFAVALLAGSSGLFFVPGLAGSGSAAVSALSQGLTGLPAALLGPSWQGSPLLWSALLPVGLVAVLYGVSRARTSLAGLAFGMAGALAFAALAGSIDVSWVPDALDRLWLAVNAGLCAVLGRAVLRR